MVGTFLFGGAISQSLTDLAKYMIGRLRPNFLAVCNPDWSKVNCSIYVQLENVCQGESRSVTESRSAVVPQDVALPPAQQCWAHGGSPRWVLRLSCCRAEPVEWVGVLWGPAGGSLMASPTLFTPQTVLLLRTLFLWDVLHDVPGGECRATGSPHVCHAPNTPSLGWLLTPARGDFSLLCHPAVRAGPPGGEVGPVAASHHPVLPHRLRHLRGLHQGVRLQAPLERRAGGAAAGGSHCRPHCECPRRSLLLGLTLASPKTSFLQVRYVSDFFKHRPPRQREEKDPERKPSLPLTLSEPEHNHYSYRGAP